jgi:hypothetical protein
MFIRTSKTMRLRPFDSTLNYYIPEFWALEGLASLWMNRGPASLFYQNFSKEIASAGDTVNVQRPNSFEASRYGVADTTTYQDPSASNIAIKLNQPTEVPFFVNNLQADLAKKDLITTYLDPAAEAINRAFERVGACQVYQFLSNRKGKLGGLTTSNAWQYVTDVGVTLDTNLAPPMHRYGFLSPAAKGTMMQNEAFFSAEKVGDQGTALRTASIGEKGNINWMMSQCVCAPRIGTAYNTIQAGAVNNSGGYAAGTTSLTVDGLTAAITAGTWLVIAGDDTPQRVVSTTGGSTPTAMVISPGLDYAVLNDAVISLYTPGAVNKVGGYAAGYSKKIIVDGFAKFPQLGQGICFDEDGDNIYGIIAVDSANNTIVLDRPLEEAISNDDDAFLLPGGTYNFVFNPLAVALIHRPLMQIPSDMGVRCSVQSYNGYSLRAQLGYNMDDKAFKIILDTLFGVKKLYNEFGAVLLT